MLTPLTQATAQEFPPKKTISMVVGFVPGGAADTGARIIAKKLGENLGVAVTVENKAGAGGNIAHQYTATGTQQGWAVLCNFTVEAKAISAIGQRLLGFKAQIALGKMFITLFNVRRIAANQVECESRRLMQQTIEKVRLNKANVLRAKFVGIELGDPQGIG